ncbi:MAG: hypothetical protein LBV04_01805 [Deferribacteraceae bacterium]|jgi:hypothetical protein|nr:hypothetical protein [Deferribacteraceae bacterium]
MNKLVNVIKKLISNTKSGKIKWEKPFYGDGVSCIINDNTIRLTTTDRFKIAEALEEHYEIIIEFSDSNGMTYARANSDELSKNDSQLGKDIHDMYERANQEVMEANLDTLISALDEI